MNGVVHRLWLAGHSQPGARTAHCLLSCRRPQAPTKLHLTLVEPASEDDLKQSVNGQLLAAGLARLVEPKGPQVGAHSGTARLAPLVELPSAAPPAARACVGDRLKWAACLLQLNGGSFAAHHQLSHRCLRPCPRQSPEAREVLEALRECQEQARRRHAGMYQYGDPGSEEEDDGGFPTLGGKPGAGRGGRR